MRNVKKKEKLGGKGKLTDSLINKLTKYYGLAIRRNVNDIDKMEKAIMATYYHLCATNTNAEKNHENCPPGADSWCKYQAAQAKGEAYDHPPPLHPDVQKHIFSIYQDLSNKDLLERCIGGHTQNANESFNATIWRLAPKHLNVGIKIIEIAAYIAACVFNEDYNSVLKIMNILEIKIGQQCRMFAEMYNEKRINRQERRSLTATKEARSAHKQEKLEQNELYEETEGLLYAPGIAD